jgi:hypothetical protein
MFIDGGSRPPRALSLNDILFLKVIQGATGAGAPVCACKYLLTRVQGARRLLAQHARVQIRQQALPDDATNPVPARIDVEASLKLLKGLDPRFKCIESSRQLDRFWSRSEKVHHNLHLLGLPLTNRP